MKHAEKKNKKGRKLARDFYNQEAYDYAKMYRRGYDEYPANLIRLEMVTKRLKQNKIKTVLDAGCGSGGPMVKLLKNGFKVKGFDFSASMVKAAKEELARNGFSPDLVFQSDLEKGGGLPKEKFDAALAFGVFPHILNDKKALANLNQNVKKGGRVFIEFRNDLFALFSLNKYSLSFFLNELIDLSAMPEKSTQEIINFYATRLKADKPRKNSQGKISYGDILAKFHNPLTISEKLFAPTGLAVEKIHFYHYHALPPIFEKKYPEIFRKLSRRLENPADWRGYFMASAFVVEAVKKN